MGLYRVLGVNGYNFTGDTESKPCTIWTTCSLFSLFTVLPQPLLWMMYPPQGSPSRTRPSGALVVSNQGQVSPEHIHQDATYQDHSRIPSQPQPSPLIGLGHKTLHENVFGPNYSSLGVHHREQSRVISISIETSNNLFTSLNNSLSNQCCPSKSSPTMRFKKAGNTCSRQVSRDLHHT